MTDDIFSRPKERDRVVGVPVESTTNLSFGGANLDVAYVTWITRMVKGGGPKAWGRRLLAVQGLGVRSLREPSFAN